MRKGLSLNMSIKIPIAEPNIGELERKYLLEAYDSGWISSKGSFIERFEEKFAEWLGVNFAITCGNGTQALHLACLAIGIKSGDGVSVTQDSYYACENVLKIIGAEKHLVSRDYEIIVHNYGYVSQIYFTIGCIEDCSEALGSKHEGKLVGTSVAISTFSFYGNKTMTTGEGGMVCTNNPEYARKIRHLKNQCMLEPYIHDGVGYNYRMTNLQAAIGLAQLERVEELLDKKRFITTLYSKNLNQEKFKAPKPIENSDPVLWMNVFEVDNQVKFRRYMEANGIETRPGFNPAQNLVMLPSGTTLTKEQVLDVCKISNSYYR